MVKKNFAAAPPHIERRGNYRAKCAVQSGEKKFAAAPLHSNYHALCAVVVVKKKFAAAPPHILLMAITALNARCIYYSIVYPARAGRLAPAARGFW